MSVRNAIRVLTFLGLVGGVPGYALAQDQPGIGVVSTLIGEATVARGTTTQPLALKTRDDVFMQDRISTKERSLVHVLLGGKALLTVRELSVLTITEDGGRATVDLQSGKVGLAVVRQRMKPGEIIEIRTPHAVAAVRGTVLVVEIVPGAENQASAASTNVHLLHGKLDVSLASNPTARSPLALRLAVQTPGSVLYLGRPCYLASNADTRCTRDAWTQARYSSDVIASMNAAMKHALSNASIVLVGYSGGGTIAALMARDNPNVIAVVTIAANLDTAAWSERHGYAPLTGSLNPAEESALPGSLLQLHLIAERDENVAPETVVRYLARLSEKQVWRFPEFDHVCCWERDWPQIQSRIQHAVETLSPPTAR